MLVLQGTLRDAQINRLSLIKEHSDDPVAWLNNQLVIDYPDDAEVLRLAMSGTNRDEVVKIVNKIVEVYMKEIVQRERDLRLEHEAKLGRSLFEHDRGAAKAARFAARARGPAQYQRVRLRHD